MDQWWCICEEIRRGWQLSVEIYLSFCRGTLFLGLGLAWARDEWRSRITTYSSFSYHGLRASDFEKVRGRLFALGGCCNNMAEISLYGVMLHLPETAGSQLGLPEKKYDLFQAVWGVIDGSNLSEALRNWLAGTKVCGYFHRFCCRLLRDDSRSWPRVTRSLRNWVAAWV